MAGEGAAGADEVYRAERFHRGGRDQSHGLRGRCGGVLVYLHARGIHTGMNTEKYSMTGVVYSCCDLARLPTKRSLFHTAVHTYSVPGMFFYLHARGIHTGT